MSVYRTARYAATGAVPSLWYMSFALVDSRFALFGLSYQRGTIIVDPF